MSSRAWKYPGRGVCARATFFPIFVLAANGVHHIIIKYCKEGLIKGLGCRDNTYSMINLHYADDTLLFGKEYLPQVMILKWILFCYER